MWYWIATVLVWMICPPIGIIMAVFRFMWSDHSDG